MDGQKHKFVVADVFTSVPLEGNPVAVFLEAENLTAPLMQQIANEMHLSETVFVLPPRADGDVMVRIFTPVNELAFAGHPTLGAAIILSRIHAGHTLSMETGMGKVVFHLERPENGTVGSARMSQPVPTWDYYDRVDSLLPALGLTPGDLKRPIEIYRNGPRHVFVPFPDVASLRELQPDHRLLGRLPDVAINCYAPDGSHWRNRMFSPAYGVVEDAATGSAAGALAVHLLRHGDTESGHWIDIDQGVEMGRPSRMRAAAYATGHQIHSVEVAGEAVVVAEGHLFV